MEGVNLEQFASNLLRGQSGEGDLAAQLAALSNSQGAALSNPQLPGVQGFPQLQWAQLLPGASTSQGGNPTGPLPVALGQQGPAQAGGLVPTELDKQKKQAAFAAAFKNVLKLPVGERQPAADPSPMPDASRDSGLSIVPSTTPSPVPSIVPSTAPSAVPAIMPVTAHSTAPSALPGIMPGTAPNSVLDPLAQLLSSAGVAAGTLPAAGLTGQLAGAGLAGLPAGLGGQLLTAGLTGQLPAGLGGQLTAGLPGQPAGVPGQLDVAALAAGTFPAAGLTQPLDPAAQQFLAGVTATAAAGAAGQPADPLQQLMASIQQPAAAGLTAGSLAGFTGGLLPGGLGAAPLGLLQPPQPDPAQAQLAEQWLQLELQQTQQNLQSLTAQAQINVSLSPNGGNPAGLPCKHWAAGKCNFADCKYSHEGPGGNSPLGPFAGTGKPKPVSTEDQIMTLLSLGIDPATAGLAATLPPMAADRGGNPNGLPCKHWSVGKCNVRVCNFSHEGHGFPNPRGVFQGAIPGRGGAGPYEKEKEKERSR